MKKAIMSNKKNQKDRSKKPCVCGGHQGKRGKKIKKSRERRCGDKWYTYARIVSGVITIKHWDVVKCITLGGLIMSVIVNVNI